MTFYKFITIVKNTEYREFRRFNELRSKTENLKTIKKCLNISKEDLDIVEDQYQDLEDEFINIVKIIKRDYSLMK
uniref:Uncharacterized protein n=1 Tax=viral metagenome TaxID=1070528 RepID=A0A6C0AC37_9ZZZZ